MLILDQPCYILSRYTVEQFTVSAANFRYCDGQGEDTECLPTEDNIQGEDADFSQEEIMTKGSCQPEYTGAIYQIQ